GTFAEFTAFSSLATAATPRAAIVVDVDNDGRLDILVADEGLLEIFFGNAGGTFDTGATTAIGGGAQSVDAADVDGDGRLDVVTSNNTNASLSVLRQSPARTFTAST